jgi:hypothetical protein
MKEDQQSTQPPPLQGSATTTAGILTLVTGGLGLFAQVMAVIQGKAVDPLQMAGSIGTVTTGVGLLKAADSKQAKKAKKAK